MTPSGPIMHDILKRLPAAVVFLMLASGCLPGWVTVHPSIPVHETLFSYATYESVQRTPMGSVMVYKIDGMVGEGFVAIAPYQPEPERDGDLVFSRIETGTEWLVLGRTSEGDYVCESYLYPDPMLLGMPVPWNFCLIVNEIGQPYGYAACGDSLIRVQPWPKKPYNFLKKHSRVFVKGSVKQELVYANRLHDKIMLTYREYRDDLKQPSFEQTLVFDLAQSKDVGFRGLHLEVIEATPAHIRFIVKAPFN